jgi:phosphonate transport system ATP-binding protein
VGAGVRLNGVTKRFPNGVEALKGIDLSFDPGEVAVVLGPSGSGKSTLLRTINGLESTSSGKVQVGDLQVQAKNLLAVRRHVGMVFQQFNLVPRLTVMANVLCGRLAYRNWLTSLFFTFPASDFDLAYAAIEKVGLKGREWDRVDRLSGGQQQRVAIARTLVQQPQVILADEPVASLDPSTSEGVMELLVNLARQNGTTLIINLHQVDLAMRYADRIVGIKQGLVHSDTLPNGFTEELQRSLYA